MTTKTKIITLILAGVLLCAGIGTTLAYFVDSEQVHNVITTGGIDISIKEWQMVDGEMRPYPDEPISVLPGTTVSKIVTFENHDSDCYVRASYDIAFYDKDDNKMDIDSETLNTLLMIMIDDSNWTLAEDGWYYYNKPLAEDETSLPFFEEAVFADFELGNEFQHSTAIIKVNAQAVQKANNGENAMEAVGWPEE